MAGFEPIVVAHRGLAGHAPENTVAAYAAALELGFGLEVDLSLTADDRIVMIHDRRLDRTTNGEGIVGETLLRQIRALDAGSWFHPAFCDQRVPTLSEALALIRERRRLPTVIALDLKSWEQHLEGEICQLVASHGLTDQVLAIGMTIHSREVRERFKQANPLFSTAILVHSPAEWQEALSDDSADWLYIRFIPTLGQAADAHKGGKRILKAGPLSNGIEPQNWRRLRDVGVDAILSDYPLECRRALQGDQTNKEDGR